MHDDPVLGTIELVVALLGALTLVAMVVRRWRLPLSVALVVFGLIVAAFSPSHITVENGSACPLSRAANEMSPTRPFSKSMVAFSPSAYSKR